MKALSGANFRRTLESNVDALYWSVNGLSAYLNQRCSTCKQYEDPIRASDLECYFPRCQNGLFAQLTAKPLEATAIAAFFPRQPFSTAPSFTLLCPNRELPVPASQLVWGGDAA